MDTLNDLTFCPANESLWVVWENHGFSRCFIYTISSSVLLAWIAIFGFSEWWIYRKYGTALELRILSRRPLYNAQLFLTWFLVVLAAAQVVLDFFQVSKHKLYGFTILWGSLTALSWLISLYLVHLERCFALPSVPAGGHGLILLIFWAGALMFESVLFVSFNSPVWFFHVKEIKNRLSFGLFVVRYATTASLFFLGLRAPGIPRVEDYLLDAQMPYTLHVQPVSQSSGFMNKCRTIIPFVWPKSNKRLQVCVLICLVILIIGRILMPLVPVMLKTIVDGLTLSKNNHARFFVWYDVFLYSLLIFLVEGSNSLLINLRSFVWIRVQQFTTKSIQLKLYTHLHSLSLAWHLARNTGAVLKILDRGTSSLNTILTSVLFQIAPAIADIVIAFCYLTYRFNLWLGLIVLTSASIYLISTFYITEWRAKFRRSMNELDNAAQGCGVDALLNFETVKCFNAEPEEFKKYSACIDKFQSAEWLSSASLCLLNITQKSIVSLGALTGSLLCAYYVYNGRFGMTAGDFVLFVAYTAQLYTPLNFLSTYYRMLQNSFIDMENMLELLDHRPEVVDHHGALELKLQQSHIEFRDVCFGYQQSQPPILKHVSFVVPHGHTVALVGTTGSGKSTVLRLLFRLYDVQSGQILVDGQNIASVTQRSLRSHIGIVPQDTVLFNTSIRENIRYGRLSATDDDVERAAIAAELHDSILRMPDGYETVVGERGLRLSGGEKQRVAIARVLLKSPPIVILDEATSALDTQTERNIQRALGTVIVNRTSLVVAHRLSTIVNANQIIVLENGEIVEQGNHQELLAFGKKYAAMWSQQQECEEQQEQVCNESEDESIRRKRSHPSTGAAADGRRL